MGTIIAEQHQTNNSHWQKIVEELISPMAIDIDGNGPADIRGE
ncbi:Uncharacterised protein [Cedecea neteri]|uniref:Uncharacterized protein n=1 Tax=Cedecea neteri TaxID=158822 RepID=A0A2X3IH10_9ENTR|nr:Uncharacterised protein [Cedecea neteri]